MLEEIMDLINELCECKESIGWNLCDGMIYDDCDLEEIDCLLKEIEEKIKKAIDN